MRRSKYETRNLSDAIAAESTEGIAGAITEALIEGAYDSPTWKKRIVCVIPLSAFAFCGGLYRVKTLHKLPNLRGARHAIQEPKLRALVEKAGATPATSFTGRHIISSGQSALLIGSEGLTLVTKL